MSRVVVIGGGVIGCAIAESLTLERHQVTLLERDHLGDGIATFLGMVQRLVPTLGEATVQRVWAGLRPVTPDGNPVVAISSVPNVIIATGHHRKGILLAPQAATTVASLIRLKNFPLIKLSRGSTEPRR